MLTGWILLLMVGGCWTVIGITLTFARRSGCRGELFFLIGSVVAALLTLLALLALRELRIPEGEGGRITAIAVGAGLNACSQFLTMRNLGRGGCALYFALSRMGFAVSFLWCAAIWGEKVSVWNGAGILCLIVTVVLSARAKSQAAVSKATFLGFLGCLVIYIGLSVLPFGFLTQEEIAAVANPSTAGVLEKVVGPWGAWVMNIGLLIAVLSSWLAWTMIAAEIPAAAAENGTFPKQFAIQNKNGAPSVSLWVTSIIMQLAIFMVYFSNNAWNTMLSITGVMVLPAYIASTAYLWKMTEDGEFAKISSTGRAAALFTSVMGTLYGCWLVYAAGLKYLFLAVIFLALGIPVFVWARRQQKDGKPVFREGEVAVVTLLIVFALAAVYVFSRGLVSI